MWFCLGFWCGWNYYYFILVVKMKINEKINELAMYAAKNHIEIIENECKKVCDKFNCPPSDLIIEYHDKTVIKINVFGSEFTIENIYSINGEE